MKKRILTILLSTIILVSFLEGCESLLKNTQMRSRDNKSAKETTLSPGEWEVGKDISEGRYTILSNDKPSHLLILDPESDDITDVYKNTYGILDSKGENGLESITCDLKQGQLINIAGPTKLDFIPSKSEYNNKLTAGNWEVGIDIAPGRYKVTSDKGSGNFIVINKDENKVKINEILDKNGSKGPKSLECELKDGEIVELRFIKNAVFENI